MCHCGDIYCDLDWEKRTRANELHTQLESDKRFAKLSTYQAHHAIEGEVRVMIRQEFNQKAND